MSRAFVNFLLDAALLVIILAIIWTSCVLHLVFPPGTTARGWELWGLGYDEWAGVQFALLCTIALGILVHVMLHWNWVCGLIASRVFGRRGKVDEGAQTLYGVSTLIALLILTGAFLIGAQLSIRQHGITTGAPTVRL